MAKDEKGIITDNPAGTAGEISAAKEKHKKVRSKSLFREYAEVIIAAVVLALFIRTFLVQTYKIPSVSMEPTLQVGDQILVSKFLYGIRIPFLNKILINLILI